MRRGRGAAVRSARVVACVALLASVTLGVIGVIGAGCSQGTPPNPSRDDAGPVRDVEAGAEWRTVLDNLDGALLSVWGTSERDVWAVGGPLGNVGRGALVLRFDGTKWRRLAIAPRVRVLAETESFWWVHGTSASDVWLVGEKGRITHWDGAAFREDVSGTTATLFGVWAAASNDVWAVGGTPDQPNAPNDVIVHWDGTAWKPEIMPETKKGAFFKVWGSSASDVYVVGEAGIVWHRTNGGGGLSTWKREAENIATGRLVTVAGCSPNEVYAVGGRDLLVSNGSTWSRATIDASMIVNDLNGVSCNARGSESSDSESHGSVVVVGGGSLKLRRRGVDGAWTSDFGSSPFTDLHGAWADPSGAFWGVGGNFTLAARPLQPGTSRKGVIGRFGTDVVPSTIE
jgi:hypothetical protein